jgi:hypothetical protein
MNDASKVTRSSAAATRSPALTAVGPIALLIVVIAVLWVLPYQLPDSWRLVGSAVLIAFIIACWAFHLLGEPSTSLVFILLAILFKLAKPSFHRRGGWCSAVRSRRSRCKPPASAAGWRGSSSRAPGTPIRGPSPPSRLSRSALPS